MSDDKVILEAQFDPAVKTYWLVTVALLMLVTVIGIPLLPFWFLGWGAWYCRESFARLECVLTNRSLIVRKGIFFRVEKTIPLDKVQDLALRQGPLMRAFGVRSLRIETAGQSTPQGAAEADLQGVLDAQAFRDTVRKQRDLNTETAAPTQPHVAEAQPSLLSERALLEEIRDSLLRIEQQLDKP